MIKRLALAALVLLATFNLQAQNAPDVKTFRSGRGMPSPVQMWIGPSGDVASGAPSEIRLFWDDWVTSTTQSGYASLRVDPSGKLTIGSPGGVDIQGLKGLNSSHGALSGLDADDHPQYYNQARADARYLQLSGVSPMTGPLTVNRPSVGAPLILGANSTGQLVSGLNADQLDSYHAGNSSGNIPLSNGTLNTNLNADLHDGYHAGNASGQVPLSNGTLNTNLNADKADGFDFNQDVRSTATPSFAGFKVTGNTTVDYDIPAQTMLFSAGYASPISSRIFVGDGTGWQCIFSNRYHGDDRSGVTIDDRGNIITAAVSRLIPPWDGGGNILAGASINAGANIYTKASLNMNNGVWTVVNGSFLTNSGASTPYFGIYNSATAMTYGISTQLPSPSGTSTLGGYYKGLGVGGSVNGTTDPIFGVLTSTQTGNGNNATAFTIYANNKVLTYKNILDDGAGAMTAVSLKLTGGSPAVGKVLAGTDGLGNAAWATETDPVYNAAPAKGITAPDVALWRGLVNNPVWKTLADGSLSSQFAKVVIGNLAAGTERLMVQGYQGASVFSANLATILSGANTAVTTANNSTASSTWKYFDNDFSGQGTDWNCYNMTIEPWLFYRWADSVPRQINRVVIATGTGVAYPMWNGAMTLYGSNDATDGNNGTWTAIKTFPMLPSWNPNTNYTFDVLENASSYKAYKLQGPPPVTTGRILEVQFFSYSPTTDKQFWVDAGGNPGTSGNLTVTGTISEGGTLLSNKYQAKGTYLTAETDPVFAAMDTVAKLEAKVGGADLLTKTEGDGYYQPKGSYLTSYTETDPVFSAAAAKNIAASDITNWNTAYGWGNHATAGYLKSYTETDPVYTASAAAGVTSAKIANWDVAYGWGNHAGLYLPLHGKADTASDADTVDTYHLDQDVRKAASPQFAGLSLIGGLLGITGPGTQADTTSIFSILQPGGQYGSTKPFFRYSYGGAGAFYEMFMDGATDTHLASIGDHAIYLTTNGSDRLKVNSTTVLAYNGLSVQGAGIKVRTGVGHGVLLESTNYAFPQVMESDWDATYGDRLYIGVPNASALSEMLVLRRTMGLGIFTATPMAALHTVGDITATGGLYTGGAPDTKGTLRIDNSGNATLGSGEFLSGVYLKGATSNVSARPALSTTPIAGELTAYSTSGKSMNDGFLRLSAGGGTGTSSKTYIDLSGYSTVSDMVRNIVFGFSGAEQLRLDDTGLKAQAKGWFKGALTTKSNLGAGDGFASIANTTSATLHVYTTSNAVLRLQSSAAGGGFRQSSVQFYSDPDPTAWRPGYIQSNDGGSYNGMLLIYTNGSGAGQSNGSVEGLRVWNGRVGIGGLAAASTQPQAPLHVVGDATFSGGIYTGGDNATKGTLRLDASGNATLAGLKLSTGASATGQLPIASDALGNFKWTSEAVYDESANEFRLNQASAAMLLGDGTTGPTIRMLGGYASGAFFQVGKSSADTAADLTFSRYATGSTNMRSFKVYSDASNFYGTFGSSASYGQLASNAYANSFSTSDVQTADNGNALTSLYATSTNWKQGFNKTGSVRAVYAIASTQGTGNASQLVGVMGETATGNSSGTVSDAMALYARNHYPGTGTGGTTNGYGLYIEGQTGATNNYSIYAAGTSQSVLGGRLGVGAAANTEAMLDVQGLLYLGNENSTSASPGILFQNQTVVDGQWGAIYLDVTDGRMAFYTNTMGVGSREKASIARDGTFKVGSVFQVTNAGAATVNAFKMAAGAQNGYVLTSDALGNGTWQPAPTGGGGVGVEADTLATVTGRGASTTTPSTFGKLKLQDNIIYNVNGALDSNSKIVLYPDQHSTGYSTVSIGTGNWARNGYIEIYGNAGGKWTSWGNDGGHTYLTNWGGNFYLRTGDSNGNINLEPNGSGTVNINSTYGTLIQTATTGNPAIHNMTANAGADNDDKMRLVANADGSFTQDTYQSGAWVSNLTVSKTGTLTTLANINVGADYSANRQIVMYGATSPRWSQWQQNSQMVIQAGGTGNPIWMNSAASYIKASASTYIQLAAGSGSSNNIVLDTDGSVVVRDAAGANSRILLSGANGSVEAQTDYGLALAKPNPPTVAATTGGSMATGTYYYVVTTIDKNGGESQKSNEVSITLTAGQTAVSFDLTNTFYAAGAVSVKIYRSTVSGTYNTPCYIATVTAQNGYTDTAAAPSAGAPTGTPSGRSTYLSDGTNYNSSWIGGPLTIYSGGNWTTPSVLVQGAGGTGTGILALSRPLDYRWATLQWQTGSAVDWQAGTFYDYGRSSYEWALQGGTALADTYPTGAQMAVVAGPTRNIGLAGVKTPQARVQMGNGAFAINLADVTGLTATPSATGGTLAAGTYYYYVTTVSASGGETYVGPCATATVTGSTSKVTLSWTSPPISNSLSCFKIYRTTTKANPWVGQSYIGFTVNTTFDDTGLTASGQPAIYGAAYAAKINPGGDSWLLASNFGLGLDQPLTALHVRSGSASTTDDVEVRTEAWGSQVGDKGSFSMYSSTHPLAKITGYTNSGFTGDMIFYTASATDTLTEQLRIAANGLITFAGGQFYMNNGTSNFINCGAWGAAAPAKTTRSAGTKMVLWNSISASLVDYAIGIESNTQWYSVPDATSAYYFKWYGGTTQMMYLRGDGILNLSGTYQTSNNNSRQFTGSGGWIDVSSNSSGWGAVGTNIYTTYDGVNTQVKYANTHSTLGMQGLLFGYLGGGKVSMVYAKEGTGNASTAGTVPTSINHMMMWDGPNNMTGIANTNPKYKLHYGNGVSDELGLGANDYGGTQGQALASLQVAEGASGSGGKLIVKTLRWSANPYLPIERARFENDGSFRVALGQLGAPTLTPSATGGTLAAGTYSYVITAMINGVESIQSPPASVTVSGATSSVSVAWTLNMAATQYRIYRKLSTAPDWTNTLVAGLNASWTVSPWNDTGVAAGAGTPPADNNGAASVVITADGQVRMGNTANHGMWTDFSGNVQTGFNTSNYIDFRSGVFYVMLGGSWAYSWTAGTFSPYVTNASDLGGGAYRWKGIYGKSLDLDTGFTFSAGAQNGYVLQSSALGVASWVNPASLQAGWLASLDTRATNPAPSALAQGARFDFKSDTADGISSYGYHGVLTFAPWGDYSGGDAYQLAFDENGLFLRHESKGDTSWTASWDNVSNDKKCWTVASSTSRGKAMADYICDGTADNTEIQAAINAAAAAGGGTVELLEGVFYMSGGCWIQDGVSIKGQGMGATKVVSATTNCFNFWGNLGDPRNDTTLSDFEVSSTVNTSDSGGLIEAVHDTAVNNLTIERVKCSLYGPAAVGIKFHQYGSVNPAHTNVRILNCDIEGSNTNQYGILVWRKIKHLEIRGCTVNLTNSGAYNPIGIYGDATEFSVRDNHVYGRGHACIAMSQSNHGVVSGNYVDGSPYSSEGGIEVEWKSGHGGSDTAHHIVVSDNIVVGANWGIYVTARDAGELPHDITIHGNILENCSYGVKLDCGYRLAVYGNSYVGNDTDFYYSDTDAFLTPFETH